MAFDSRLRDPRPFRMIYAIISDVHGNLEALRSVLVALREERADRVLCLGDLVGYGANPNEVIAEAREVMDVCVAGNHDFGAVGKTEISLFSPTAEEACRWTRDVLEADHRQYLCQLPLINIGDLYTLAHSSPNEPSLWNYVTTYQDAEESLRVATTPLCFIGHSHVTFLVEQNEEGKLTIHEDKSVELRPGGRYLINPGSVGQPRDGCPDAAFAILNTAGMRVEIRRVPYDVRRAQENILAAGLPRSLAERLAFGY